MSQLDPREGRRLYGEDPEAYERGRPDYPEALYAVLRDRCGLRPGARVLEIGAGTGLVTRRLLADGASVTAVEPNPSMVAWLARDDDPHLRVIPRPFEETSEPGASFDLAVAATSFHWVDRGPGLAKLFEVLCPGGAVALWWMLFDDVTAHDEFAIATTSVLGMPPSQVLEPGAPPFQLDVPLWRSELEGAGFVDVTDEVMDLEVEMDAASVRALYATMAVVLRRPPDERIAGLDEVARLVDEKFGGRVLRRFPTPLYTARKP